MSRRRLHRDKEARRRQILQRYEREKARNCLAQPGQFPYVLVLDHLKAGYNVAKIFRSALAMGAHSIHLLGIGPFDPAPAKGAFRKVPARWHDDFATLKSQVVEQHYQWIALAPDADETLAETELPAHSAFIFGHEERGLSFDPGQHPDVRLLRIPQAGQMQSLNVSIAASIVMYEYLRQHGPAAGD